MGFAGPAVAFAANIHIESTQRVHADEDVGEYFNDNIFKDEAAPGALQAASLHAAVISACK